MPAVTDSTWDFRKPWVNKEELDAYIMQVLSVTCWPSTGQIARAAKCNKQQARASLKRLLLAGKIQAKGDYRNRVWAKC